MASILTFIRPFRYDIASDILIVQSGPVDLTLNVAETLRTLYDKSTIDGAVSEDSRELLTGNTFDCITIVRWEERFEAVSRLRRKRYDVVAVLYGHFDGYNLKRLPYLLRTRSILVFNENIDYFPLNIWNLSKLWKHVKGRTNVISLFFWAFRYIVLTPLAAMFLLVSVVRLYLRTAWKLFTRYLLSHRFRIGKGE